MGRRSCPASVSSTCVTPSSTFRLHCKVTRSPAYATRVSPMDANATNVVGDNSIQHAHVRSVNPLASYEVLLRVIDSAYGEPARAMLPLFHSTRGHECVVWKM